MLKGYYKAIHKLEDKDCAVWSLSVGAQVESGVMQLIVEHVTVAMTTHSHDDHVTTWAAKVFANAADNGKLSNDLYPFSCSSMCCFGSQ